MGGILLGNNYFNGWTAPGELVPHVSPSARVSAGFPNIKTNVLPSMAVTFLQNRGGYALKECELKHWSKQVPDDFCLISAPMMTFFSSLW